MTSKFHKGSISLGLTYGLRALVHYRHGGKQAGVVLELYILIHGWYAEREKEGGRACCWLLNPQSPPQGHPSSSKAAVLIAH